MKNGKHFWYNDCALITLCSENLREINVQRNEISTFPMTTTDVITKRVDLNIR